MLINPDKITYSEFLELDKNSEQLMEFIDGDVYLQASPSTVHQRISRKLTTIFDLYFSGKTCEPFVAPFDIILPVKTTDKNKVIPDLSVICDKFGLNENNYIGVPTLIIEILSPSTAWIDISKKFHLYQTNGVKEYWIISPKNNDIQIFNLDENGFYGEPSTFYGDSIAVSTVFEGLKVYLKDLFIA
ncbi:Uma2 family endonuclease [Clostridium muellerianum]|uniref:Uma2 family endonuclease n=1 Tax=Clostridium muellerianum TaxID=2716538 RepID=UPI00315A2501